MTNLGLFLAKRSINRAEVARKTGISASRLNELSLKPSTKLKADELYRIALAIEVDPCEMIESLYGELVLK